MESAKENSMKADLIAMYEIVRRLYTGDDPDFNEEVLPILQRNHMEVDEEMFIIEED